MLRPSAGSKWLILGYVRPERHHARGKLTDRVDSTRARYDLKGHLTTVGYVSWHDNRAQTDASLVKVMKDAGGRSAPRLRTCCCCYEKAKAHSVRARLIVL